VKLLPPIATRLAYRTKLRTEEEVAEKALAGDAQGRGVACVDAVEQLLSAPAYNSLKPQILELVNDVSHPFKHSVVKMSKKWAELGAVVADAYECIEADWGKFDVNRPDEDLEFFADVICSLFICKTDREYRIVAGFRQAILNGLVFKWFVTEGGGVWRFVDGVPSGSLWTSFLDTFLNTLYVRDALLASGIDGMVTAYWCGGDDLLIVLHSAVPVDCLSRFVKHLNEMFGACIRPEGLVHLTQRPFLVTKSQALFPIGTDLSAGTSKLLHLATWKEFVGKMIIDDGAGRSHRWKYNFAKRPKFLGCYWTTDLFPIKPTDVVLRKGLLPEGIHRSVDDYMTWIVSAIVDNPFNSHLFNHLCHRWIIANHLREMEGLGIPAWFTLGALRIRQAGLGDIVPFPNMLQYRRSALKGYQRVDGPELVWKSELSSFHQRILALYMRDEAGGFAPWALRRIIDHGTFVGPDEWAVDMNAFIRLFLEHPATSSLKAVKRLRMVAASDLRDEASSGRVREMWSWIREKRVGEGVGEEEYYRRLGKLLCLRRRV